jgi:hypothetical protein
MLMTGCRLFCLAAVLSGACAAEIPALSSRDTAIIEEAFNVWSSVAGDIWPGASKIKVPLVYIAEEYEYAIGFPALLSDFSNLGEIGPQRRGVQARKRTLNKDLSASFPIEGVPAVLLGSPEALGKSLGDWVVTAGHEMFHVFQAVNRGYEKVAALEIGDRNDSSWHLNFPFPYSDPDVLRLIHLQGYLAWLASASTDLEDAKYNIGTALEAVQVYRSRLAQLRPDEKTYQYSQYQQWNEGVAAYTEYKIAESVARKDYRPTPAYAALPGFQSYEELWRRQYQSRPFLAKHAGRAAKSRTAFYHLGMGKALALDKLSQTWKHRYFAPAVWLDDLLAEAIEGPK